MLLQRFTGTRSFVGLSLLALACAAAPADLSMAQIQPAPARTPTPTPAFPKREALAHYGAACVHFFRARELDRRGKTRPALSEWRNAAHSFEKVAAHDPKALLARKALAACWLRLGKRKGALASLAAISAGLGSDYQARRRLARTYQQLERPKLAIQELKKALAAVRGPHGPEQGRRAAPPKREERGAMMMDLARLHRKVNKPSDALSCYEKVLADDPFAPKALAGAAQCHAEIGNRREALHFFEKYYEDPERLRTSHALLTTYATQYEKLHQEAEGGRVFARLVKHAPDNLHLRQLTILLHQKAGRVEPAVLQAEDFLKRRPQAHSVRLLLAGLHTAKEKPAKAIGEYSAIMASPAPAAGPYLKRAIAARLRSIAARRILRKQYELAAAALEGILRAKSREIGAQEHVRAQVHLAKVYARLNRFTDAAALAGKAVRADKTQWSTHLFLAHLRMRQGRLDHAVSGLEQARKQFAKNESAAKEISFTLAGAYARQGRSDKAEEALKTTLKIDPSHGPANNHLGYIYALQNRNLDEAVRLIRIALKQAPDVGAYIDSLGWAYYKIALRDHDLGKLKLSVGKLERAAALRKEPAVLEHLADALFALGKWEEASRRWKESLALMKTTDPGAERPAPKVIPAKIAHVERLLRDERNAAEGAPKARPLLVPPLTNNIRP